MKHEEKGAVIMVDQVESGTSKAGKEWRKCAIVVDTDTSESRRYPCPVKITFWNDKAAAAASLRVGDEVEVGFYLRGSEYNGRYKVELNGADIKVVRAAAPEPAPANAGGSQSAVADPVAEDPDDLPF